MTYLEFFSNIISAMAWPLSAIAIVLILRGEISSLLSRVKRIRHKDSEIDLAAEVIEAKKSADEIPELLEKSLAPEQSRMDRLAEDSPRGAILDAWLVVDEAMTNYGKRYGINNANNNVPPFRKIENIRMVNLDSGNLGNGVIEMLDRLRRIRNDAVHKTDSEITSETARDYAALAARVTAKLEEA